MNQDASVSKNDYDKMIQRSKIEKPAFARQARAQSFTAGGIRADGTQASTSRGERQQNTFEWIHQRIIQKRPTHHTKKYTNNAQSVQASASGRHISVRKHEVCSLASERWSRSGLHNRHTVQMQWKGSILVRYCSHVLPCGSVGIVRY